MEEKMKKIISILCTLALCLSIMAFAGFAPQTAQVENERNNITTVRPWNDPLTLIDLPCDSTVNVNIVVPNEPLHPLFYHNAGTPSNWLATMTLDRFYRPMPCTCGPYPGPPCRCRTSMLTGYTAGGESGSDLCDFYDGGDEPWMSMRSMQNNTGFTNSRGVNYVSYLVLNLRDHMYFWNSRIDLYGPTQVTAYSIYDLINYAQNERVGTPMYNVWRHVAEVQVMDELTIKLYLSTPYNMFWRHLATPAASIVMVPRFNRGNIWMDYVGSGERGIWGGPTGNYFLGLEKFWPDEWITAPQVAYVTIQVVPDRNARIIMLETGEADIAYLGLVDGNDFQRLQENENINIAIRQRNATTLVFNTESLSVSVRRAIGHAIDRVAISQLITNGLLAPSDNGILWGINWKHPLVHGINFDLDKARVILDEAGYTYIGPDGIRYCQCCWQPMRLELLVLAGDTAMQNMAWFVAALLEEIKIEVILIDNLSVCNFNYAATNGHFDMVLWNYNFLWAPYTLRNFLHSEGIGGSNISRFNSPNFDHLMYAAKYWGCICEEIQEYLLEHLPVLNIGWGGNVVAWRNGPLCNCC